MVLRRPVKAKDEGSNPSLPAIRPCSIEGNAPACHVGEEGAIPFRDSINNMYYKNIGKHSWLIAKAIRKVIVIADKLPWWNLIGRMKCHNHIFGLNGLESRMIHSFDGGSLIIWCRKAKKMKIRNETVNKASS